MDFVADRFVSGARFRALTVVNVFTKGCLAFVGRALDVWAYVNKVRIDFARPGKPTDKRVRQVIQRSTTRIRQRAPMTSRPSPCWSARAVHSSSTWGGISLLSRSLELFLFQRK